MHIFTLEFTVPDNLDGGTVEHILRSHLKMSQRMIRTLKQTDGVLRNAVPVDRLYRRVTHGDVLTVLLPEETSDIAPESMNLEVCYEDSGVVMVNKPPGVLTHPTARERQGSLLAGVRAYLEPDGLVPHCIHRLDRDTSGLLLFAKHAYVHHLYDRLVRRHALHREYLALCYAPDTRGTDGTWQTIQSSIAGDESKPSRRVLVETGGQTAVTHYRVLARTARAAVVQLSLETGRTHQIRIHLASVGLPLIGDTDYTYQLYGNAPRDAATYAHMANGQQLHAFRLSFSTPIEQHPVCVESPLRPEMLELWEMLGGHQTDCNLVNCEFFCGNATVEE